MNRVLFSGKIFNETELKRVNAILQTQAALVWSSVRTYSFLYNKGRKKYLEGYLGGSDATSDWTDTTKTIQATNQMLQEKVVNGINAAQQAGTQAREEEASDQRNDNGTAETVNSGSTVEDIVEGLPENDGFQDPGRASEIDEFLAQWDEATEQERGDLAKAETAAAEALGNYNDAQDQWHNASEAWEVTIPSSGPGTATYTDVNGNEHTVTNTGAGGVSYTGYEYNGETGTLTTTSGGTTIFTPDGGGPQVTIEDGTTVAGVVGTDTTALGQEAREKNAELENALDDVNRLQEDINQRTETYNEMAKQNAEDNKDPDSGNGGYSESDSSTWSDPSYDPGEWEGF